MGKKLFFLISFLVFSITSVSSLELPNVYVRGLKLDQTSFKQGSTVRGTVTIANDSAQNISDVSYIVKLVGKFDKAGNATELYDQVPSSPFFLTAREKKEVNFEYKLPKNTSGNDLGIEFAVTLSSGADLGWQSQKVSIDGQGIFVKITDAYVFYSGYRFEIQDGPTLKEGETGKIIFSVTNQNKTNLVLLPVLEVYDRNADIGDKLISQNMDKITLTSGKSATQSFNLPLFDYKPGVYEGVIHIYDSSGSIAGSRIPFRYIIAGDIATIQNVVADKSEIIRNENLKVTVAVTGNAPDLTNFTGTDNVPSTVSVKVFNENNILIASGQKDLVLDSKPSVEIIMKAANDAKAMHAEVKVEKKGKLLAEKDMTLSTLDTIIDPMVKAEANSWSRFLKTTNKTYIFLTFSAIFLIFAAGSIYYSLRKPKKHIKNKINMIILIFTSTTMLALIIPTNSYAYTETDAKWHPNLPVCGTVNGRTIRCNGTTNWPNEKSVKVYHGYSANKSSYMNVFVNEPFGNICAGQQFYVSGSVMTPASNNTPQSSYIIGSFNKKTYSLRRGTKDIQKTSEANSIYTKLKYGGLSTLIQNRFSLGPFTAPTDPGIYKVNLGVAYDSGSQEGYGSILGGSYGYQEFNVTTDPVLCAEASCPTGTSRINGQCVKSCPSDAVIVNGQCGCLNGGTVESNCSVCPGEIAMENNSCTGACDFINACGQIKEGTLDGENCTMPAGSNPNESCISTFNVSSNIISRNGSVDFSWKIAKVEGVGSRCGFVDLTTSTPRPVPGLQVLDPNLEKTKIKNIQSATRYCLVCQFYDLADNAVLGEVAAHEWVRIMGMGDN